MAVVGQRVPRIEGPEKVSGQALYAADVRLPGTLWGKVLRSPHPHARIVRIDTANALALPGVRAVLTGWDIPPTLVGRRLKDVPVLAREIVRYVGDRVVALAADEADVAEQALGLIEVEYQELEPLLDPLRAIEPGALLLHPDLASYENVPPNLPADIPNIHSYVERKRGDLEAGFAEADLVVESTYSAAIVHQAYLEPHACLVDIDRAGRVHVWTSNKSPYSLRTHLSEALGISEELIVVEHVRIGGEFGGKGSLMDVPIAYYLARATERPVRLVMSHTEELTAANPRHAAVMTFKTGLKKDGTITAHRAVTLFDSGAYGGHKPVPGNVLGGGVKTGGCYRIPNVSLQCSIAYTNHVPGGFMRAPGDPQAIFGTESHFDQAARAVGLDGLEFRRRNVLRPGDVAPGGDQWDDIRAREVLEAVVAASSWGQPKGPDIGRGVAIVHRHIGGGENQTLVTLFADGRVQLTTGVPDAGSGIHTAMRQIAAEVLTIPPERIEIQLGNTDQAPPDPGIGGARHMHTAGQGTYRGALELSERMRGYLAEERGWQEDRIVLEQGQFRLQPAGTNGPAHGEPFDKLRTGPVEPSHADFPSSAHGEPVEPWALPFADVARLAVAAAGGPVEFMSVYSKPQVEQQSFIAQVAEVEVDRETGAFKVLQLVTGQDAGVLINPVGAEGQVEGGIIQGLGFAVMEELRLDEGRVANPSFGDYKIPTSADVPDLKLVWLDAAGPLPYNGKNVGEHSLIPTAPAIANAIYDAVGVRITSTPITAEKIHAALRRGG